MNTDEITEAEKMYHLHEGAARQSAEKVDVAEKALQQAKFEFLQMESTAAKIRDISMRFDFDTKMRAQRRSQIDAEKKNAIAKLDNALVDIRDGDAVERALTRVLRIENELCELNGQTMLDMCNEQHISKAVQSAKLALEKKRVEISALETKLSEAQQRHDSRREELIEATRTLADLRRAARKQP